MSADCPWCGLESTDEHTCEWCGRIFAPAPPSQPPPSPAQGPDPNAPPDPLTTPHYLAPVGLRLQWFCGLYFPMVAVLMAAGHFGHISNLVSLTAFISGFLVSTYQLVRSIDEDAAPVGVGAVVQLMFGPVAALIIFMGAWILFRTREVATVLLLLIIHLFSLTLILYSMQPEIGLVWDKIYVGGLTNLVFLATIVGWALANFWRPLNE